jgi:hypothetical protein
MNQVLQAMDDDGVLADYITSVYNLHKGMALGASNYLIPEVADRVREAIYSPKPPAVAKKLRVTLTPGNDYEGYIEMDRQRYGANGILVISTTGQEESVFGDF